ncbi:Regulator of nonsense transcripts 3B like [Actinidia chinensis var. chinensis]|uniref:Regulator of nonsense transcripts 3B like n=1 Tax=Actinidia chinensis var. chinensis TaxID=1590841 RepID=A0A2R6RG33_ACTCC|nr:Regulator of nonsense transcripts 3B like [Actinidia chinensis var. chinensis]
MGNGESTQPRAATEEEDLAHKETAKTVLAVAGAMLLGWGLSKIVTGSDEKRDRKKMKAPGKNSVIYRDDFERDPTGYFRSLRK